MAHVLKTGVAVDPASRGLNPKEYRMTLTVHRIDERPLSEKELATIGVVLAGDEMPNASPGAPASQTPQGLSPLALAMLEAARREAEACPDIEAAFVRPDGGAFVMTGSVRMGIGLVHAIAALERVQSQVAPSLEPLLDGDYRPTGKRMVQGWVVAFERR